MNLVSNWDTPSGVTCGLTKQRKKNLGELHVKLGQVLFRGHLWPEKKKKKILSMNLVSNWDTSSSEVTCGLKKKLTLNEPRVKLGNVLFRSHLWFDKTKENNLGELNVKLGHVLFKGHLWPEKKRKNSQ